MHYDIKPVFWNEIEPRLPEEYDEAFLALLREDLKKREENSKTLMLLEPHFYSGRGDFWACGKEKNEELFEAFTAAMVHAARRLKDCNLIAGFVLPNFEKDWAGLAQKGQSAACTQSFQAAFKKKYARFVFVKKTL